MLITALSVLDYRQARKVKITPPTNRSLIRIVGKNRAGKSSTLGALNALFGGAKEIGPDPVHHGAKESHLFGELDNGLTIDRTITPDGKTQLEVRDAEGIVRRPQERLDALIGARFLDPLKFLRLDAGEQLAQLMKLIPDAARIVGLNEKRKGAFDRRREVGQELTKAKGALARLPEVQVGTKIDVAALAAEQRAFGEQQRAGEATGAALRQAETQAAAANDRLGGVLTQIEELRRALAQIEARVPELQAELERKVRDANAARNQVDAAAAAWASTSDRRAQIDDQLARANEHNEAVTKAAAQNERRSEAQAAVTKLDEDYKTCTNAISIIDERKASILAAAKLPVEGLAIGDDCILLNGVPFGQAAASEQWRGALELAIAGTGELDDIWIRDGAVLDDESIDIVERLAERAGKRVWVELVGTDHDDAIVIRDGEVVP